ncbi:tRNA (adenosine(37)-N6)-threonylcarbamoyltransferase complex dimerization subunit type 1 TsaB [Chloroflexota bacterium]
MQLAIDTSNDYAGLALAREGKVIAEITWKAGQNHTTGLLPALLDLLRLAQVGPDSLSSISVALGPGSYNGLRAGLSTAKGLAFALDIPLVGIGTLEIEAYPHYPSTLPICPVHNAGREEIAAALYQWQDGKGQELEAPHLTTIPALIRKTDKATIFCGELTDDIVSQIKASLGHLAVIYPPVVTPRRVGFLTLLAWQRLSEDRSDDPATLQPLYLRGPAITTPKARPYLKGMQNAQ